MTGFEPRTSGIGSDRSTNWATQPLPSKLFVDIDLTTIQLPNVWPSLDGSQWTFHSQGPGSNPGHSNNALLKKDQKEIKTCNDVFLIVQYFYLHKSFQASFYIGTFNNTCTNVKNFRWLDLNTAPLVSEVPTWMLYKIFIKWLISYLRCLFVALKE